LIPRENACPSIIEDSLRRWQMTIGIMADSHDNLPKVRREILLVNPGECGGWLTGRSSGASIDLDKLEGKIF